jgi:hypothetical protein
MNEVIYINHIINNLKLLEYKKKIQILNDISNDTEQIITKDSLINLLISCNKIIKPKYKKKYYIINEDLDKIDVEYDYEQKYFYYWIFDKDNNPNKQIVSIEEVMQETPNKYYYTNINNNKLYFYLYQYNRKKKYYIYLENNNIIQKFLINCNEFNINKEQNYEFHENYIIDEQDNIPIWFY